MALEQTVTNQDGATKLVLANDQASLDEQLAASQGDALAPSPDIDNPAHGNVVVSEFVAEEEAAEVVKRGPGRPKKEVAAEVAPAEDAPVE